jgi:TATA-box binding protein (TBP) (component of TFIID and TFIIIB)
MSGASEGLSGEGGGRGRGKWGADSKLSSLLERAKTFGAPREMKTPITPRPVPTSAAGSRNNYGGGGGGGNGEPAGVKTQQHTGLVGPVPMEMSPLELMQLSVNAGTVKEISANRIERKQPNVEAMAKPTMLRLAVPKDDAHLVSAAAAVAVAAPVSPPPPSSIRPDRKEPPIGTRRLWLSECSDLSAKSRCSHEVVVQTYLGRGKIGRESWGMVVGCYIASTADQLGLRIPPEWQDHLAEQKSANVNRLQQPYHKVDRKTRPGSKRKRPPVSIPPVSTTSDTSTKTGHSGGGGGGGGGDGHSEALIKSSRRKSKTGIGGRRAGNSTSKQRLKIFVRVLVLFQLTKRNSVHKGTTVPVDDMYGMCDLSMGAYHPMTFPAVQLRNSDPHGTVSAMESGELSVSSAPSEDEALILALQQVIITSLQFKKPPILENFGAANITASAGLGWAIDLDKLADFIRTHPLYKHITYDRTMFPGLHWALKQPAGVVLGFFELGFVNAVGLKEDSHFNFVRDVILPEINANRKHLENKQKTQTSIPIQNSESDKAYAELIEHADSTMNKLVEDVADAFDSLAL